MDIPYRRLMIDSRHGLKGGTNDNFVIALPESFQLPRNAVAVVSDLCISQSVQTIEDTIANGANSYLYFVEQDSGVLVLNQAYLQPGQYAADDLATEIGNAMTIASVLTNPTYTVTFDASSNTVVMTSDVGGFALANKDLLEDSAFQAFYTSRAETTSGPYVMDWANPQDCFEIIGLGRNSSRNMSFSHFQQVIGWGLPRVARTGFCNMSRIHCLHLHSRALSTSQTYGSAGSRSIIAKIPMSGIYGSFIFVPHSGHTLDYVPCGGRVLSLLDFFLTDQDNVPVDIKGGRLSFTIIFGTETSLV